METQAFRAEFDVEDEDRFFISGVEKAGRSRNTYEHQLRKKRILVGVAIGIGSLGLVALILGLAWGLGRRSLDYDCPRTYKPDQAKLVFYVIGDWGRSGNDNQRKVARLMEDVAQCMPPNFIISTGDNFYPSGLSSASDPGFSASFSNVYTASALQVPWYAVMGNHDYGDQVDESLLKSGQCLSNVTSPDQCTGKCCYSPWWQTVPEISARDWRWNGTLGGVVTRTIPLGGGGVPADKLDILFMDTNPMIEAYRDTKWASFLKGINNWNSDAIQDQLRQQLNASYNSGSKWRLVVGHHPVRSYGAHCSNQMEEIRNDCYSMSVIRDHLKDFRVAAYINGHDHDQQLIKPAREPTYFVVSGAGSDVRKGEFDTVSADALFLSDTPGFLAVVMMGDLMRLHFYTTAQRTPAYTWDIPMPTW